MQQFHADIITEISALTRKIEEQYPELQKYIDESRNTLPSGGVVSKNLDIEDLKNYRDSLKDLIEKYDSKN